MHLTAVVVERLQHEGKLHFRDVRDDRTPGMALRLLAGGGRRWIMRYRVSGKIRVGVLGDAGAGGLSLKEARTKAAEWRAKIGKGCDPAGEERRGLEAARKTPSVAEFAQEYLQRHAAKKRSGAEDARLLRHDILPALGELRIDAVRPRDVTLMLDKIRDRGADVVANRVLALTRVMLNFAVERGVLDRNPIVGIKVSNEPSRDRVLSDDELRRLWEATDPKSARMGPATRLALRLLTLTGCRSHEICALRHEEIDLEANEIVLGKERTKNKREHRVPLSVPARAVVREAKAIFADGPFLLPGRDKGHVSPSWVLQSLQQSLSSDVTVHDLRRTAATGMQKLGVRLEVIEAALNHVSGSRRGVVGVYQTHDWAGEKKIALETWGRKVIGLTDGEADNVVELRATG